jgi:hypothetical protein
MAQADIQVHPQQFPRQMSLNGLRVREDTLYCNHKGEESKSIRKKAEKAIQKLEAPLQRLLQADETILYVAHAQAPVSLFEQLTLGWYTYRITKTVLVFTNRRMLHFLVNTNGTWKRSLRTVHWGDIAELKIAGAIFSRNLKLQYHSGKKETYWAVRPTDAKNIKLLAAAVLPASTGEPTAARAPQQLCPDCLAVLTPSVYTCSGCGLGFKDERTLTKLSLLIPGGGYFYVGQKLMGVGDFIVEAYLLLLLIIGAVVLILAPPAERTNESILLVVLIAAILAVEKWGTIHHCRRMIRDYIPKTAASSPLRAKAAMR